MRLFLCLLLLMGASKPPEDFVGLNFNSTTGKGVVESPANTFTIPKCGDGRKIGYITARISPPLKETIMRVEFSVSASGQIVSFENSSTVVRLALHFQRDRDDFKLRKYNQGYRWWSRARKDLVVGDHVHEVPIQKDLWTGGGTQEQRYWDAARNDVENVGVTLGDNQTAGHGVCMASGTGSITIKSLTIGDWE